MLCQRHTMMQLYPCQRHLSAFRAHGCSSCFCHPISSCCPSLSSAAIGLQTHTHTHTNKTHTCSQSTHVNKQTISSLYTSGHNHIQSLSVSVHTPLLPNMLVRSLFCAGWNQTGQRAFFFFFASGTFLRESVQLCHPQEGSPRHADPTGDSGLLSGSLSTVSLSFSLFISPSRHAGALRFFLQQHTFFPQYIRKPLARPRRAADKALEGSGSSVCVFFLLLLLVPVSL